VPVQAQVQAQAQAPVPALVLAPALVLVLALALLFMCNLKKQDQKTNCLTKQEGVLVQLGSAQTNQ